MTFVIPAELAAILPEGIAAEWMSPIIERSPYDGAEEQLTAQMAPARRREFLAGRWLARQAITQLGGTELAIGRGPSREPVWPAGFSGSITHSANGCFVVVARRVDYPSLGVDLEEATALGEELWESVCTARELVALAAEPQELRGLCAKRIFSAKEAFYKYQYPLTGTFLEFQDVGVQFLPGGERFVATLLGEVAGAISVPRAHGRLAEFGGNHVSLVAG